MRISDLIDEKNHKYHQKSSNHSLSSVTEKKNYLKIQILRKENGNVSPSSHQNKSEPIGHPVTNQKCPKTTGSNYKNITIQSSNDHVHTSSLNGKIQQERNGEIKKEVKINVSLLQPSQNEFLNQMGSADNSIIINKHEMSSTVPVTLMSTHTTYPELGCHPRFQSNHSAISKSSNSTEIHSHLTTFTLPAIQSITYPSTKNLFNTTGSSSPDSAQHFQTIPENNSQSSTYHHVTDHTRHQLYTNNSNSLNNRTINPPSNCQGSIASNQKGSKITDSKNHATKRKRELSQQSKNFDQFSINQNQDSPSSLAKSVSVTSSIETAHSWSKWNDTLQGSSIQLGDITPRMTGMTIQSPTSTTVCTQGNIAQQPHQEQQFLIASTNNEHPCSAIPSSSYPPYHYPYSATASHQDHYHHRNLMNIHQQFSQSHYDYTLSHQTNAPSDQTFKTYSFQEKIYGQQQAQNFLFYNHSDFAFHRSYNTESNSNMLVLDNELDHFGHPSTNTNNKFYPIIHQESGTSSHSSSHFCSNSLSSSNITTRLIEQQNHSYRENVSAASSHAPSPSSHIGSTYNEPSFDQTNTYSTEPRSRHFGRSTQSTKSSSRKQSRPSISSVATEPSSTHSQYVTSQSESCFSPSVDVRNQDFQHTHSPSSAHPSKQSSFREKQAVSPLKQRQPSQKQNEDVGKFHPFFRVSKTAPKRPKVFFCPIEGCQQGFTRKQNLKSHLGCHSEERPHVCEFCSLAFRRRQEMLRHVRTKHGGEDAVICTCLVCEKKFSRIDAFYRHLESKKAIRAGCSALAFKSLEEAKK